MARSVLWLVTPRPGSTAEQVAKLRPDLVPALDAAMFDALQRAVRRVQAWWPIRTGRSLLAWGVLREGALAYVIRNDAREKYGAYAGYVHRKGDPFVIANDGLRPGGLVYEVQEALRELDLEASALLAAQPSVRVGLAVSGIRADLVRSLRSLVAEAPVVGRETALQNLTVRAEAAGASAPLLTRLHALVVAEQSRREAA